MQYWEKSGIIIDKTFYEPLIESLFEKRACNCLLEIFCYLGINSLYYHVHVVLHKLEIILINSIMKNRNNFRALPV